VGAHFPWGSVLALDPARWPPRGTMHQEAVAQSCAIVAFVFRCSRCDPGHSRDQEGGESTELFAAVSFSRAKLGAPLDRRLFSAEDADSARPFSDLVKPLPNLVDL